ncbi:hypothetical protein RJ55_08311 [Drechmeria coniospora]|nr:hypothetical protein RJ55_08311 [Drechmeria coniospora]
MLPRRRYRLLTIFAAVVVFLFYRSAPSWRGLQHDVDPLGPASGPKGNDAQPILRNDQAEDSSTFKDDKAQVAADAAGPDSPSAGSEAAASRPSTIAEPASEGPSSPRVHVSLAVPNDENQPGPQWQPADAGPPTDKLHWTKPPERFPIPKESIIKLPAGRRKRIPKIQHSFQPESKASKDVRLERLAKVRGEIARAWGGYRSYAWMHDELSPVSGRHRDPFCGWAATLVDSLDTLWIAGLRDEFDEAAKAVKNIDFTATPRFSIPVFETTIRYLGGLIAAYDVSGGKRGNYPFLLEKARQLAEVLMGIFDTPNRMPILFYQWQPQFASQTHTAGQASIAEFGTLSLEFTRLAQLTGENKYYDAVDRITDSLVELQKAGTVIPGLFPEHLDISGCNHTATLARDMMSRAAQHQVDSNKDPGEASGYGEGAKESVGDGDASDKSGEVLPRADADAAVGKRADGTDGPLAASGSRAEWDCVKQGVVPVSYGSQSFHLGGSQDSAYEYFPKQHLLLGGLAPKYQKLYEDMADAVKEWLLFRPMVAGDWNVLFPARINTMGKPKEDLDVVYDVTHLTCFVGGMFGLGGKLFGRDKDVELAKQFTDGCVWAYQSTVTGVMAESARVMSCPTLDKCEFNEKQWHESLDPYQEWRDKRLQQWQNRTQELMAEYRERKAASSDPSSSAAAANPPPDDVDESTINPEPKPMSHAEYIKNILDTESTPKGVVAMNSPNYILRPEAIESVWYMYRITGDPTWMDKGWVMFEATVRATRTSIANSAIRNVNHKDPALTDEMESFWLAETLKYYFLLFSEPSVISLDEWVLNTEAHPFKL